MSPYVWEARRDKNVWQVLNRAEEKALLEQKSQQHLSYLGSDAGLIWLKKKAVIHPAMNYNKTGNNSMQPLYFDVFFFLLLCD